MSAVPRSRSVVEKAVPRLVRALCDAGWIVEVEGKPARPAGAIRIEVTSGILELQAKKRALADAILGAESATLRGLTRSDVEMLLSG